MTVVFFLLLGGIAAAIRLGWERCFTGLFLMFLGGIVGAKGLNFYLFRYQHEDFPTRLLFGSAGAAVGVLGGLFVGIILLVYNKLTKKKPPAEDA